METQGVPSHCPLSAFNLKTYGLQLRPSQRELKRSDHLELCFLKLARMVWFAETFVNWYVDTAPQLAPSTRTVETAYPELGVIIKVLLPPADIAVVPTGEMDPPCPLEADMVYELE